MNNLLPKIGDEYERSCAFQVNHDIILPCKWITYKVIYINKSEYINLLGRGSWIAFCAMVDSDVHFFNSESSVWSE